MSIFSDQTDEIKTLISSETKANKSFGYSTLLHYQEQSSNSSASIQALAETSPTLLSFIVADISCDDEEIAAQALKCLGFMIYHPSLVAGIAVDDVNLILESLVRLITTTKMKSVCNLGVWCISIQQFNASFLDRHHHSLLRAVVHALDNPIGSLSTTFEAVQAVMKLAAQLSEKMREFSHIWAPPIYRRLLSIDKRERDMSERCMLKIRSTVLPPPLVLSKVLVKDMKQRLLTGMRELLNQGMKVQTIQAWGWFIRLLGSYAIKNRHLINEMLKIPEQTFSDLDPQVQITSQVAWEGLIDALINPPTVAGETSAAKEENGAQQVRISTGTSGEIEANGFLKSVKLIMTPLVGIMSNKCDASVHSSCLNTWLYLLHKLDTSVNDPSVIKLVLEPICEAVFLNGPDSKSICLWNLCLDLLDDFILAKGRNVECGSTSLASQQLSARTSICGPSISANFSWKQFSIKWLAWDLSQLDFHLKMIFVLIRQSSTAIVTHEKRSSACDAALRLFRSILKGVKLELKKPSTNYNDIMFCLGTILRCIKKICEDVNSEGNDSNNLHHNYLPFIEAVTEELGPALLGSPLYKMSLDLKYIGNLQSVNEVRRPKVLDICPIAYMNMVSPMVYLIVLYFCVVVQLNLNTSKAGLILQRMQKYFKVLFSLYDPLENLLATIGFLHKYVGPNCLKIWIAVTKGLKDCIDDVEDLSLLKMESDRTSYHVICYLLSYPFVVCSCTEKTSTSMISGSSEKSHVSSVRKLELEDVIEVWKSLYGSLTTPQCECSAINSFLEDLCSMLNGFLDKYTSKLGCMNDLDLSYKDLDLDLLSLSGNAVVCVLEQIHTSKVCSDRSNYKDSSDYKVPSGIGNSLRLAARYMKLLWTKIRTNPSSGLVETSRVFSALTYFVSCLHLKQDILFFIEIISCPLLQWLLQIEMHDESTIDQFQLLWAKILNCIRSSQPQIIFDSAFLQLQAPLLEKTIDHPNPSISEPTITFWNSTYAEQVKLDYPQILLHVLDKLSRNGRINLCMRSLPHLERCHSRMEVNTAPQRYKVIAKHYTTSKRVEFMEYTANQLQRKDKLSSRLKRKRSELTEHQKEVRRAQQGRERDCGGHGPGIRTYTSADFSQGNEDSQESQEIRNSESILEKLKRAGNFS